MTAEPSNASTERILHLMLLLMQGEYSKDEIFSRIAAYEHGAEDDARRRMLDRDLATMQKAGIEVSRHAGMVSLEIMSPARLTGIVASHLWRGHSCG